MGSIVQPHVSVLHWVYIMIQALRGREKEESSEIVRGGDNTFNISGHVFLIFRIKINLLCMICEDLLM